MKISECCKIVSGGTPSTQNADFWNGNIPWISIKDFNATNKNIYGTEKFITEKGLKNCPSKLLQKGDLIISARGSVGHIAKIIIPMAFNQSCYGISPKEDVINSDFLFYWFKSNCKIFNASQQGNVFKTITRDFFDSCEINVPEMSTQLRIANILGSIDEKIEINRKRIEKLESLAKLIYDYWFVQFDFPDASGNPYKSSGGAMVYNEILKREIPIGWRIGHIQDLVNTQSGYAFKSSEWIKNGHPVLTIKSITNNTINLNEASFIAKNMPRYEKYCVNNGNMIIAMTGNTIGKVGIIASNVKNILINQRVCILRSNYNNIAFCYFNLQSKSIQTKIWQISQNSSQPNISEEQINKLDILLPPQELYEEFNKMSASSFEKLIYLLIETQKLISFRDFLLPLLMNGQVMATE